MSAGELLESNDVSRPFIFIPEPQNEGASYPETIKAKKLRQIVGEQESVQMGVDLITYLEFYYSHSTSAEWVGRIAEGLISISARYY